VKEMKREWRLDDGSSVEKRRLTPICSPFEKKHKIQIRAYPADARGPLTNHPEGPQWRASLRKYLDDVRYPREAAAGTKGGEGEGRGEGEEENAGDDDEAVASWLLRHALSLSYSDAKEKFTEAERALLSEQVGRGALALDEADAAAPAAGGGPPFVDLTGSDAVREACGELCLALGVVREDGEGEGDGDEALALARRLERAEEALTERYLPAASAFAEAEAQRASSSSAPSSSAAPPSAPSAPSASSFAAALLDAQPLGFTTGDPLVDRGAKALRWLYVKDLAALQKSVDAAIVGVQNETASPRTDAALGKVGR